MTREEAKKEIIDMANTLQLIPNTPKGKAVSMALKALEQEQKWIPVSERLPNIHEIILATYEVEDGSRIAITGYGKYGFLVGNVTAWMPLPEPYSRRQNA